MMLGLYLPGSSALHQGPAWLKLAILCVVGTAIMFVPSPLILALALVVLGLLYAVARVPLRLIWKMSWGILLVVVIVAGLQTLLVSWHMGALVGLRILLLVCAANLVTMTTPTSELVDVIERVFSPLRRLGVHPERIGLAVSLTLRFIPVISEEGRKIREAQAARGVRAPLTYLVPLIIRTIRMADGIGESMEARGVV